VTDTRVFDLTDGRELAWIEYGVADGSPVVAFHGTPGNRYNYVSQADVAARRGVRLIVPDRPGYGHSTYDPAHSYEQWTRDVAQLVDHLGIDRFAVLGTSGGGPHAAACARFLGDRLSGCAIVSGIAPPAAMVPTDRMMRTNRIMQSIAPRVPRLLSIMVGAGLRQVQRTPDRGLAWMRRTLPPCDVEVLERPEILAAAREDLARPPSATAARASVQDLELALRPWGFRLRDITGSVHVWHGDLDRNVPVESGVYQANQIPHATLHRFSDHGHWLVYEYFDDILTELVE
jgi:pimeloyl-ACP methyl ester carboxylesterase